MHDDFAAGGRGVIIMHDRIENANAKNPSRINKIRTQRRKEINWPFGNPN